MKNSVIERPDGGISYAPVIRDQRADETDAEFADAYSRRLIQAFPTGTHKGLVDDVNLPQGRYFRAAWRWKTTKVSVDMPTARSIKVDEIRLVRDARLVATDIEVSKLDGATIPAPLKDKRKALRDLPATVQPDLDAITTPEALEAYEPAWPA